MSIVLLWIILKSLGIIQTPFWLQYGLPASSFVIGVFALYYNLIKGIADLTIKTSNIEKDFEIIKDTNKKMDRRFEKLEDKFNSVDRKFMLIEQRI